MRSGNHITEATRIKMSQSHIGKLGTMLGRHHTEEAKAKMSSAQRGNQNSLGKHHTEETKTKLRELTRLGLMGRKGQKNTPEHNARISASNRKAYADPERRETLSIRQREHMRNPLARERLREVNLGKKQPVEQRKAHSENLKEYYRSHTPYWLGKHQSPEHRKKNRLSHIGICAGAKHPKWRGGATLEPYGIGWTMAKKKLAKERDYYTCQFCFQKKEILDEHHIDYNMNNNDIDNWISLCHSCHSRLHAYTKVNREYWQHYYKLYMSLRRTLMLPVARIEQFYPIPFLSEKQERELEALVC